MRYYLEVIYHTLMYVGILMYFIAPWKLGRKVTYWRGWWTMKMMMMRSPNTCWQRNGLSFLQRLKLVEKKVSFLTFKGDLYILINLVHLETDLKNPRWNNTSMHLVLLNFYSTIKAGSKLPFWSLLNFELHGNQGYIEPRWTWAFMFMQNFGLSPLICRMLLK